MDSLTLSKTPAAREPALLNLVLYQPEIPPNTGNVARLCVGAGLRLHLIHPLGFNIDEPAVRRAGLDYWRHLDLQEHKSWESFSQNYPQARLHLFSKKALRPYSQAHFQLNDFLVFGPETRGLPESWLDWPHAQSWAIPMRGPTRSLNLSTSVGIVTYEALRQVSEGFQKFF